MSDGACYIPDDGLSIGDILAERYRLCSVLGRGGMGNVYLAHDLKHQRNVALKVLAPERAKKEAFRKRFFREIALLKRVKHPNVVRIFGYNSGAYDHRIFYVMEYVPGRTLSYVIEQGALPLQLLPHVLIEIADALTAIHGARIVHRDITPANVLIRYDAAIKLGDFGIARTGTSSLTRQNQILGSSHYIAPEVWQGAKITPLVDLYSLGVLMYEACTGNLPFTGESPGVLMRKHLDEKPVSPMQLRSDLYPWLSQVVLRLLEKDPLSRFASASELFETACACYGDQAPITADSEIFQSAIPSQNRLEPLEGRLEMPTKIHKAKPRILAIDDDPVVNILVRDILSNENYDVVIARSGTEALSLLEVEENPNEFHCILLDVNMPGISGRDVLARLKLHARTQNIPVIMLTSEDEPEQFMDAYNSGAVYYITKPFTKDQLLYGLKLLQGE